MPAHHDNHHEPIRPTAARDSLPRPTADPARTPPPHAPSAADVEQRLHDLQLELDHVRPLATLGTLVSLIAHELRNLMTPIVSYAQLALERPTDPAMNARALRGASLGGQRAIQVADAILALSNDPRWNARSTERAAADVAACVRDALLCIGHAPTAGPAKPVARPPIGMDVPGGLRARIEPAALQQAVMNLVLNARAATGNRPGAVRVAAHPEADPSAVPELARALGTEGSTWNGTWVVIEIADSGPGIPEALRPHLFEPWSRPGISREGHGLGLYTTRRLVEGAGGRIELADTSELGTTFRIWLPQLDSGTAEATLVPESRASESRGARSAA